MTASDARCTGIYVIIIIVYAHLHVYVYCGTYIIYYYNIYVCLHTTSDHCVLLHEVHNIIYVVYTPGYTIGLIILCRRSRSLEFEVGVAKDKVL